MQRRTTLHYTAINHTIQTFGFYLRIDTYWYINIYLHIYLKVRAESLPASLLLFQFCYFYTLGSFSACAHQVNNFTTTTVLLLYFKGFRELWPTYTQCLPGYLHMCKLRVKSSYLFLLSHPGRDNCGVKQISQCRVMIGVYYYCCYCHTA